jgi:hypothetical protein
MFDHGDCVACNDGCQDAMIGDGVCQEACNLAACGFDEGDCLTFKTCAQAKSACVDDADDTTCAEEWSTAVRRCVPTADADSADPAPQRHLLDSDPTPSPTAYPTPNSLTYTLMCLENYRAGVEDAWAHVLFGAILDLCEDDFREYDDEQYYRVRFHGKHSMDLGGDLLLTFDMKVDDRAQDLMYYQHEADARRRRRATAEEANACGLRSQQPCVFPFTFDEKPYTACVKLEQDEQPWCAVSVDADGAVAGAEYGVDWDFCTPCVDANAAADLPLRLVPFSQSGAFVAEFQRHEAPVFVEGSVPSSESHVTLASCDAAYREAILMTFQALQEADPKCIDMSTEGYECQSEDCAAAICAFFAAVSAAINEGGCDAPEACNIRGVVGAEERTIDVCRPFLGDGQDAFWEACGETVGDACAAIDLDLPLLADELLATWTSRSVRYAVRMEANIFHLQV